MSSVQDFREERGRAIAKVDGQVKRLDAYSYTVNSQSGNGVYDVLSTEIGWLCECPDHMYREVKCKHIWAVEISLALRRKVESSIVIQPISVKSCPKCKSESIKRHGIRHNKHADLQKFQCKDCGYWFTVNLGFEGMRATPQIITSAMQLYFTGESFSWETHPSKDPRWFSDGGKNLGDFWTLTPEPTKAKHFAAYPLKLCFTPILAACPPDGVVLDPFAGTGTTAEAVEILNISGKKPDWETVKKIRADIKTGHKPLVYTSSRKWILLEISGGYCEIAEKRLAPYGR